MTRWMSLREELRARPRRWLVTGAGGFIGSHLAERLLSLDQEVTGLDNFATGRRENVEAVKAAVTPAQAARYRFVEGDIRDPLACGRACEGAQVVLHQAAMGSVPRSIKDPITSHEVNVTGFLRVLEAAREASIRRVVYASSSSVYGDHPALPKVEDATGHALSPYAATKQTDERYAEVWARCYGLEPVGLRYFNVFGPRQDPSGAYAAVVPLWFSGLFHGREVALFGDGETSRDFCFVENVIQANLLAATTTHPGAPGQAFNIACGDRTTLKELFGLVRERVARHEPSAAKREPVFRDFRPGDIRHSLANIEKARTVLGYEVAVTVAAGLDLAAPWYLAEAKAGR
jgi:UDP-N-acetylglucosamine 4-epimerase